MHRETKIKGLANQLIKPSPTTINRMPPKNLAKTNNLVTLKASVILLGIHPATT
jgi:hypothetical protein